MRGRPARHRAPQRLRLHAAPKDEYRAKHLVVLVVYLCHPEIDASSSPAVYAQLLLTGAYFYGVVAPRAPIKVYEYV